MVGSYLHTRASNLNRDTLQSQALSLEPVVLWIPQVTAFICPDTRRREFLARLSNFASKPPSNHLVMQSIRRGATNNLKISPLFAQGDFSLLCMVVYLAFT